MSLRICTVCGFQGYGEHHCDDYKPLITYGHLNTQDSILREIKEKLDLILEELRKK